MSIDSLISHRVRDLRTSRGYALDKLADLSGVSRSMISLIERGKSSPTASVLSKLADALGVPLASLFAEVSEREKPLPLARHSEQLVWRDPDTGYLRRHVSPSNFPSRLELSEVTFPPGQSVTFENAQRNASIQQQVWVLDGAMEITVGEQVWHLDTGDCLAMLLSQPIKFRNTSPETARYLVALTSIPPIGKESK